MWLYGMENLNRKKTDGRVRVSLGDAPSRPKPGTHAPGSAEAKAVYKDEVKGVRAAANTILYPEITEDLYSVTFRISATQP